MKNAKRGPENQPGSLESVEIDEVREDAMSLPEGQPGGLASVMRREQLEEARSEPVRKSTLPGQFPG